MISFYHMTNMMPVTPQTKIVLDALCALFQIPPATVIERALNAYRGTLNSADQAALESFCARALYNREGLLSQAAQQTAKTGQPATIYEATRLTFKRELIERLGPEEQFRVITPIGVFQMSKGEFYREFPNVVASESYKNKGVYSYPQLPSKAEEFRVPNE
jgi:hypothetical protein